MNEKLLTREKFDALTLKYNQTHPHASHWNPNRWVYHELAANCLSKINPQSVLEIGTMGIKVFDSSITMDYDVGAGWIADKPDVEHNAKEIPWPFLNRQFDCIIALRVFHHLHPKQRECFNEAKRVAKNVILVIPDSYQETHIGSKAIQLIDLIDWNHGIPPKMYVNTGHGNFYFWDEASYS